MPLQRLVMARGIAKAHLKTRFSQPPATRAEQLCSVRPGLTGAVAYIPARAQANVQAHAETGATANQ